MNLIKSKMIELYNLCQYKRDCKAEKVDGSCNGDCKSGLNHQMEEIDSECGYKAGARIR